MPKLTGSQQPAVPAEARRSPEAAEGLRAFAEKRPPKWAVE